MGSDRSGRYRPTPNYTAEGVPPAENSELVAVTSLDEELVKEIGKEFGAKPYITPKELLEDPNVEAVYIATPAYLHADQFIAAAQHKKHVLIEKPMAMTIEQCQKMIDVCRKNKVKLGVGYMMRFHAHHQKLREMVAEGALGKPVMGRAQISCWYLWVHGDRSLNSAAADR